MEFRSFCVRVGTAPFEMRVLRARPLRCLWRVRAMPTEKFDRMVVVVSG